MTCRLSATRPASWSAGSADATQEEDVTSRRRVSSAETRLIMNSVSSSLVFVISSSDSHSAFLSWVLLSCLVFVVEHVEAYRVALHPNSESEHQTLLHPCRRQASSVMRKQQQQSQSSSVTVD